MAGLDHDLKSIIVDLSQMPLDQLCALDDSLLTASAERLVSADDEGDRLWSSPTPGQGLPGNARSNCSRQTL